jgi:hypothetical protein
MKIILKEHKCAHFNIVTAFLTSYFQILLITSISFVITLFYREKNYACDLCFQHARACKLPIAKKKVVLYTHVA